MIDRDDDNGTIAQLYLEQWMWPIHTDHIKGH